MRSETTSGQTETCVHRNMMLGDVAAKFPAAADVFKAYRIDFCCHGNRPLHEAIAARGLHEEEVLSRLHDACAARQAAAEPDADWQAAPFGRLIDHIVERHHGYLHRALPELADYIQTIANVHGLQHPELATVRSLFGTMREELMAHLPREETELFPAIRRLEASASSAEIDRCKRQIETLEDEHASCGEILAQIRRLTNDYALPADACPTYQLTFRKLEELESDLFQHIHLENNVLFPRARGM